MNIGCTTRKNWGRAHLERFTKVGMHQNEPLQEKGFVKITELQFQRLYHLENKIKHYNIIQIYDVKTAKGFVWIMMEFCNLGDLNRSFKKYWAYFQNLDVKVELMKQIANGIAFLHSQDIVHRDIKAGNILLKSTPQGQVLAKVSDFGISKVLKADSMFSLMSSDVGTLIFKAPEFFAEEKYRRNVDVYAEGLMFTSMLQAQERKDLIPQAEGLTKLEAKNPIGYVMYQRKTSNKPEVDVVENKPGDNALTKEVKKLIQGMTSVDPQNRLSSLSVKEKLESVVRVSNFFTHTNITPINL